MIEIHYCPEGQAINDFNVEKEYQLILQHKNALSAYYFYSTDNIFMRIRLGIVQGDLDYKDVIFIFNNQRLEINKYGACLDWPHGFCDLVSRLAEKVLITAMKMKKAERK